MSTKCQFDCFAKISNLYIYCNFALNIYAGFKSSHVGAADSIFDA